MFPGCGTKSPDHAVELPERDCGVVAPNYVDENREWQYHVSTVGDVENMVVGVEYLLQIWGERRVIVR